MNNDEQKILFVFQDANFCPKAMLVPTREFTECRAEDLELLLSQATDKGVLTQNIIWNGSCGTPEKHIWSIIASEIMNVAEWGGRMRLKA